VLDLVVAMRLTPVLYLLHLIGIGMNPSICDNMAETVHSTRVEVNFVSAQIKLSFVQLVELLHEVDLMLFNG